MSIDICVDMCAGAMGLDMYMTMCTGVCGDVIIVSRLALTMQIDDTAQMCVWTCV